MTELLKMRYLYTKIGPICAVCGLKNNEIHMVEVWDGDVSVTALKQKYSHIISQAWLNYNKQEGFVSAYSLFPNHRQNQSELQQKIIHQINLIPVGQTRSYKDVAQQTGNAHWARAVGRACSSNLFPLIIPCHRVVGVANPWAYSGAMLDGHNSRIKKSLIEFEQT